MIKLFPQGLVRCCAQRGRGLLVNHAGSNAIRCIILRGWTGWGEGNREPYRSTHEQPKKWSYCMLQPQDQADQLPVKPPLLKRLNWFQSSFLIFFHSFALVAL